MDVRLSFLRSNLQPKPVASCRDGSNKPPRWHRWSRRRVSGDFLVRGNRLAYAQRSLTRTFGVVKLPGPHDKSIPLHPKGAPFITSTRLDANPQFSPDARESFSRPVA